MPPILYYKKDWGHFCDQKGKNQFFNCSVEHCGDTNICKLSGKGEK